MVVIAKRNPAMVVEEILENPEFADDSYPNWLEKEKAARRIRNPNTGFGCKKKRMSEDRKLEPRPTSATVLKAVRHGFC